MPWAVRMYTEKFRELMGENHEAVYNKDDIEAMLGAGEKAFEEKRDKAASIGDYVHQFAEEYMKDLNAKKAYDRMLDALGQPSEDEKPKIDAGVVGLQKWLEENKIQILSAENILYSVEHEYVGKYDAITIKDGKKYLTDYKTSNGIYNEYYYQTAAYLHAWEEEYGEQLDGVMIIGIVKEDKEDKEGNIVKQAGQIIHEIRSREDVLKDFEAFKGLLMVKNREKELQKDYYNNNK